MCVFVLLRMAVIWQTTLKEYGDDVSSIHPSERHFPFVNYVEKSWRKCTLAIQCKSKWTKLEMNMSKFFERMTFFWCIGLKFFLFAHKNVCWSFDEIDVYLDKILDFFMYDKKRQSNWLIIQIALKLWQWKKHSKLPAHGFPSVPIAIVCEKTDLFTFLYFCKGKKGTIVCNEWKCIATLLMWNFFPGLILIWFYLHFPCEINSIWIT